MSNKKLHSKEKWDDYVAQEIERVYPFLQKMGYTLYDEQVHVRGERYLMGNKKLVLNAEHKDKGRVIIKVSSHAKGKEELIQEKKRRDFLRSVKFAYKDFSLPEELFFETKNGSLISITTYISQDQHIIDRGLEEQFFIALKSLETQEGVHATAYSHTQTIKNIFGVLTPESYIKKFKGYKTNSLHKNPQNKHLATIFNDAEKFLIQGKPTLECYSGFLTHSDFVPHNVRIKGHDIYLLDHTSIWFGNKYEGWARFVNFMVHHNPDLEEALCSYVKLNRGEDEYLSLRLMRIYKLGFLLNYYSDTLEKTEGDMHKLMRTRLTFWTEVMKAVLDDKQISKNVLAKFLEEEDMLRSDEERARRKEIISLRK